MELENHEVVPVNGGVPAESFIDYVGRSGFDNYDDYLEIAGADRLIIEMPFARTGSFRPTFARRSASHRPPTCTGAPPPDANRMARKRSDVHRPIKGFSPAAPGRHAGSGRIGKPDRGGPAV